MTPGPIRVAAMAALAAAPALAQARADVSNALGGNPFAPKPR